MAYATSTTPPVPVHPAAVSPTGPNMAAYEAALRDLAVFARLQSDLVAAECEQMVEGL